MAKYLRFVDFQHMSSLAAVPTLTRCCEDAIPVRMVTAWISVKKCQCVFTNRRDGPQSSDTQTKFVYQMAVAHGVAEDSPQMSAH